jgi:hypothetical protein
LRSSAYRPRRSSQASLAGDLIYTGKQRVPKEEHVERLIDGFSFRARAEHLYGTVQLVLVMFRFFLRIRAFPLVLRLRADSGGLAMSRPRLYGCGFLLYTLC